MADKMKNLLFWGVVGAVSTAYITALGFKCFKVGDGGPVGLAFVFILSTVVLSFFGGFYWQYCRENITNRGFGDKLRGLGFGIIDLMLWAGALVCIICTIQVVLPGPDLCLLGYHFPW